MAGGHKVDADELARAGKLVRDTPRNSLERPLDDLKDIQISAQDFGRKHTENFTEYESGIERAVACAESYLVASDVFGDKLDGAGATYAKDDEANAQSFRSN
ncbi:MAG: hypothetical protein ACRDSE_24520 [Pseudonocardiaceae bacterium]